MDAWETLAAVSTSGDAFERLSNITGGTDGTITHAYEAGIFSIAEVGAEFTAGVDTVTFDTTETGSIEFITDSQQIEFIGTDTIEVQS